VIFESFIYNENMGELQKICKLLRYYILTSTTAAGSGHLTSSLSAVELMATLFYKHFRFELNAQEFIGNDRLIFSKGHASPLFYSLYVIAGKLTEKKCEFRNSSVGGASYERFAYTKFQILWGRIVGRLG
jgi:transketolase